MAAMIEFVCIATHEGRGDPAITLEQRAWAYCAAGAADKHQWTRIDPTAVETLRTPPGSGGGGSGGAGAGDKHKWPRIDPTAVETLRSPAGNGHVHLTSDESDE